MIIAKLAHATRAVHTMSVGQWTLLLIVMAVALGAGVYKFRLYPSATVVVTSDVSTAGSLVVAHWALPIPSSTDWIGVFPISSSDSHERIAWRHTDGSRSGTMSLLLPVTATAGIYELRLYARNGTNAIARSQWIQVRHAAISFYTDSPLGATSAVLATASTIFVRWSIPTPSEDDWIGLFPVGAARIEDRLTWRQTGGAEEGTTEVAAPTSAPPGVYEVRLFSAGADTAVARSSQVEVTDAYVSPVTNVRTGESGVPATPGSTIRVGWFLAKPASVDWIGLFPLSVTGQETHVAWRDTGGTKSGTLDLSIPVTARPGAYELRVYGSSATARSAPVQITYPSATLLTGAPSSPIPADLSDLVPRAREALAAQSDTWAQAEAVRHLVRAALPSGDCSVLSFAYWSIGRIVGLPLRLVASTANGENAFDTHATVEVWLPELSRWVISDPTFDGYWTRGADGQPMGALDIRDSAREGRMDDIYWHSTSGINAIAPADYYVNPLHLYAHVWVQTYLAGESAWTSDEDGPRLDTRVFRVLDGIDLRHVMPDAAVKVAVVTPDANDYYFGNPPRYARSALIRTTVEEFIELNLDFSGSVTVTVADSRAWRVLTKDRTFDLTPNFGLQVSPIVSIDGTIVLITDEPAQRAVDVVVYEADRFPVQNQVAPPPTPSR